MINNEILERVKECMYMGKTASENSAHEKEISRIRMGRRTSGKHCGVKGNRPLTIKRKLYNQRIFIALTCARKLDITQKKRRKN